MTGIRASALLFALCGLYLVLIGLLLLVRPGSVPLSAAAPLLFGLELAGPYMLLLIAAASFAIAWGLVRRINLLRHAALLAAVAGVAMLVPSVSAAAMIIHPRALALGGLGVIVRVIIVWYLSRSDTAAQFRAA